MPAKADNTLQKITSKPFELLLQGERFTQLVALKREKEPMIEQLKASIENLKSNPCNEVKRLEAERDGALRFITIIDKDE